ncbi:MAG: hypothetical protein NDI94_00145, partial [Candidatus Woesearchaeota archaeon]|nr:hypothetical protein [Candidatus Woesearchaeota archaeon]
QKRGYNMALEKEYDVILRSFNDEREYLLFWAYCSERNVEGYINEIISSELDDAIYVHGKDFNEFCTEFYELKRKLGNRYLESMRENLDYAQRLIVSTSAADDRTTDLFEEWVSAAVHWSLAIGIDIRDEVRAKASAFYDKCAYTEKEVNNKIVEIYFNESMSVFRSTYPRL